MLILEYARYFGHYHVCLRLWHRLAERFNVLGLWMKSRWWFLRHVEEILIEFFISLLWATLFQCTRFACTSKVRLALSSGSAIELKIFWISCSCKITSNRLELRLDVCLFLLEVLVSSVLHFSDFWLIIMIVIVVFLHFPDILISEVLRVLLLHRLTLRMLTYLILWFDVNISVLCLYLRVCLVILMYLWITDLWVVSWLLEIFPLASNILTFTSSPQIKEILPVMFVSPDVSLLLWLNLKLLKRLWMFVLGFNFIQELFSLHKQNRYGRILVFVVTSWFDYILLLVWLPSHNWNVGIIVLSL